MIEFNLKSAASRPLVLMSGLLLSATLGAQTVTVHELSSAPTLDGAVADWAEVEATTIALVKSVPEATSDVSSVSVKAGTFGDNVYFLLEWEDTTQDIEHKPYVWDAEKKKYGKGEQQEDRLAIQFEMEGDYTTDWFSGNIFKADMWHWKAFRSNELGLVHDKSTLIGDQAVKRAYKTEAKNGKTIYIRRPSDAGSKLYKTKRYSEKQEDVMPKYILTENPEGSVADVKAKGVWKDGRWALEIARALDTGHEDDVAFARGASVKGGIAIFDHSGNEDHNMSDTLTFEFQ